MSFLVIEFSVTSIYKLQALWKSNHLTSLINRLTMTPGRRWVTATVLWLIFWPLLSYIQIGEITGYKMFFWLVGAMNYPAALVIFLIVDGLLDQFELNHWIIFVISCAIAGASVPLYHFRVGFPLGVYLDAYLF